jgi:subfamily B ATP-binding cassette protein MsbA
MGNLYRLAGYLKPYLAGFVVASVLLAASGALASAVVATLEPLVNQVLLGKAPAPTESGGNIAFEMAKRLVPADRVAKWSRRDALVQVPVFIVVVFLIRGLLLYFGQYGTTRVGVRVVRDIRVDLFDAVVRQSLEFFQAHPTGLIMSRILGDVQRLQRVSTAVLADLMRVTAMVPFLVVVIFVTDWKMALFASVALPLLAYPMVRLGKRLRRASVRSQESMAEVSSVLNETISGVKVVQGFGMERFESDRFRTSLDEMLRADLRATRAAALAPAVMELVGAMAGAGLFAVAGYRIAAGVLDPGRFTVVMGGLALLYMSLRRLNALNVEIQQGLAAAGRVFGMMDRQSAITDAPGAPPLPPFEREIRFESVEFAYDDDNVLDGIDVVLKRGEVTALVGPSGSGKSTLANLVPRFFDPTAGRILVDGRDLREVDLASLRGQIGLVTQETVLFDDTVKRNIAYGRDDRSMDRIVEAAKAANAHGFIRKLPSGYDTRLGEKGVRLSVGQRQRLTIARALLADPPILILDEATSALDSESEVLVQRALEVLMQGRTTLVIAHRLATIRRADRILVLEEGRIVEDGDHGSLLRRDGVFARLHRLQFEERDAAAPSVEAGLDP